jgi:hypothetical protein
VASKLARVNNTSQTISFKNGGFLSVYSLENPDSIRGESFHVCVVDECGQIPQDVISEAISPTLADEDGTLWLIGTPKGRGNGFHQEFVRGLEDNTGHQRSWSAPSSSNPNPNIQKAVEAARQRISSRSFKQEWLAEFVESGGEVFRNIEACITAPLIVQPYQGTFVAGVDWGKSNDYTVAVVMDAETNRVVDIDRYNKIDWSFQRDRIANLHKRWGISAILAEQNSIGSPNIEALQKLGLPIRGFVTTNSTKSEIIEKLILSFENNAISISHFLPLIGELEAFEMTTLPSGLTRYSAPSGLHDDCVISLALALKAAETGVVRYHDTPW